MILTLLLISTAMSFSQVNDNTGATGKTGNGSFEAKILMQLTISNAGTTNLGEFVISNTPYNTDNGDIFESVYLDFSIVGEPGYQFSIGVVSELSNSIADIKIRTFSDVSLSGTPAPGQINLTSTTSSYTAVLDLVDGTFGFQLECYEVTAKSAGEGLFLQTVTVAYLGM